MNKKIDRKCIINCIFGGIIFLSFLATLKMFIFGLDIDEEYAITMSYRIAAGEGMFYYMWEPHQMSGFVVAIFIKIYLLLFQTLDYLVIYLRFIGAIMQLAVSFFVYLTFSKKYPKYLSLFCALFVFNLLPKWIQIPEFSNLFLWSSLVVFCSILQFSYHNIHKRWLVLAALFYCVSVLCYPTTMLTLPFYLYAIYKVAPKEYKNSFSFFIAPCVISGVLYVIYFVNKLGSTDFIFGIKQMATDGTHESSFLDKISTYGLELVGLFSYVIDMFLLAVVFWGVTIGVRKLWSKIKKKDLPGNKKLVFILCVSIASILQQIIIWNQDHLNFNEPLIFFYLLFFIGAFFCTVNQNLFFIGIVTSFVNLIGVLVLTNTTISVSGAYLLPGILASILLVYEKYKEDFNEKMNLVLGTTFLLLFLLLLFFAKGYLMCETEGALENVTYVKQKALSGPAKGIYYRYIDGYTYNILSELFQEYITEEDSVLYLGRKNLTYLLGDSKISTYSTISTPTFDERFLEYWERFPEKYPTVIIEEGDQNILGNFQDYFQDNFQEIELMVESYTIKLYRIHSIK